MILQTKKLTKKYGKSTVVDSLSISVPKGAIYGVLGPNGSGKTTTLGMILNVINPTSGTISLFSEKANDSNSRKKIGAILETPNFYPYMNAIQNLSLVAKIKDIIPEEIPRKIEDKLKLVTLYEERYKPFGKFSLGMKQRLSIASSLLNDPELLILDEPTNGLDPVGISDIRNIINTVSKNGTTVVIASHLLDEIQKVCTHLMIIKKGVEKFQGEMKEFSEGGNLEQKFLEIIS
ncbi:ABC transporter ATP-binding protein [Ichthyobacterium seriolicida]|uniref:ABC transporter, ATP-binding protein n=1 Tax=Ichthyobacterium seriolicida TaxID=242600 RepID=A0A1J1DWW2_9FLAO|nr:ATP-binding cassette domain-containing protein [Ichthyobacterium seriolicida]BAV94337.1 ABC transporter, ATP-binding protein [Ichthyobacterium seriolicida]